MNIEQIALTHVAQQFAAANSEHVKYYKDVIKNLEMTIWAITNSQPNNEIKVPLSASLMYRKEDCNFEIYEDVANRCKVIRAILNKNNAINQ